MLHFSVPSRVEPNWSMDTITISSESSSKVDEHSESDNEEAAR